MSNASRLVISSQTKMSHLFTGEEGKSCLLIFTSAPLLQLPVLSRQARVCPPGPAEMSVHISSLPDPAFNQALLCSLPTNLFIQRTVIYKMPPKAQRALFVSKPREVDEGLRCGEF